MPSSPQQPRRSWRDDAAGAGGGTNKRTWQKDPDKGSRGPWFTKRVKIYLATAALLAVIAGVVVLWLLPRHDDPPRLVLIYAGYETNLAVPHNVYGKNSVADFKQWADEYKSHHGDDPKNAIEVRQQELTKGNDPFASAVDGNPNTVVLFVTAHGGASASQAYLLRERTDLLDNYDPYTMDKALAALERLPQKTKKLLILDTTQVDVDWNLGLLHNDFVRTVASDPRIKTIDNLAILCASDENQRSWVSEDYGRTIFAHFVVEGLKGAAKQNGNGTAELTALELCTFVQTQVENWVRHNRDAKQTPKLIDPNNVAKDMVLVAVEPSTYQEPEPPQKPRTPPQNLRAAWEERDKLAATVPYPATYTPHLWRQYHESLLRYEQLLRAGDDANAATMAEQMTKLVSGIRKSQQLDYDALALTLAMPTALGWSLPGEDKQKLRQDFAALWDNPSTKEKAFAELWRDWKASVSDSRLQQLGRLFLVELVLERGRASDANFKRSCFILKSLDDALLPRPAEAHFAIMMNEFADKSRDWKRMQTALDTRVHAEQAALGLPRAAETEAGTPYCEQLLPWLRDGVDRADKVRWKRENLLFPSPKEAARLGANLEDADAQYGQLQERAAEVRAALKLRDRVLADLPYYSRWAAGQAFDAEDWLKTWDAVQDLCQLLDEPRPNDSSALKTPLEKIQFTKLAASFDREVKHFADAKDKTQKTWRHIEELLAVPLIPAKEREQLLIASANISQELNFDTKQAEKLAAVNNEQTDHLASARRQGRFALHMLGYKHDLYKPIDSKFTTPGSDWQKTLADAGKQLGDAFAKNARELYDDTDKARKAPLTDDTKRQLRSAALRIRLASGAAVASRPGRDPVGENRSVQLYELMKWQGERTFADYWTTEPRQDSGKEQPYFSRAGHIYVDAAKALAGNEKADLTTDEKAARLEALSKLETDLAADSAFAFRWRSVLRREAATNAGSRYVGDQPVLNISDEDSVQRGFGLVAPPNAPEGFPVVWEDLGERKYIDPANEGDLERRALDRIPRKPEDLPLEYVLKPRPMPPRYSDEPEKTQFAIRGFYRGREFGLETKVALNNLPEEVMFAPQMPSVGRLAITASKADYDQFAAAKSEVVIVVDHSGSMTKMVKGTGKSRKQLAQEALKACFLKIPNGVRVSLLVFNGNPDTLQDTSIIELWKQVKWNNSPDAVDSRIKQLNSVEAKGGTPLVRATLEAKKYFTKDITRAKTLVVLTDGGDNTFYHTAADAKLYDEYRSIDNCIASNFKNSGILLNVVGMELSQLDPKEDKEEIAGVKEYRPAVEHVDGAFVDLKDTAKLAEQLERLLLQLHFRLVPKGGKLPPELEDRAHDISTDKANYKKIGPLTPGLFNVEIQTNNLKPKALVQLVQVLPGEELVLKLEPTKGTDDFHLRRETYVDSYHVSHDNTVYQREEKPRRDQPDKTWIASVLQNQKMSYRGIGDGVQMMVCLEERDDKPVLKDTSASIGITRPLFVWFRAADPRKPDKPVPGLRFYPIANYPAPCYRLDYQRWPNGAETQLDIWWNELEPLPVGKKVLRPANNPLTTLVEEEVKVQPGEQEDPTPVVIENIAQERRRVILQPGDKETKEVDCLVVRLRYPVGKEPFFVQLPRDTNVGAEHRFYTQAGKYTGIFWDVSAETARELKSLTIYSVSGVLQNAQHVGPWQLGEPDNRPSP